MRTKEEKNLLRNTTPAALALALTFLMTGCLVPNNSASRTSRYSNGDGSLVILPGTNVPSGGSTPISSGSVPDNGINIMDGGSDTGSDDTVYEDPKDPPLLFEITGVGYDGSAAEMSVVVRTKDVLKVRFQPGINSERVEDSGFVPQYSKLFVHISLGDGYDAEKATPLRPNGVFEAAQASPKLDFSAYIDSNAGPADADGYRDVVINVRKANNNYWCYNYGMYCTHTHVHHTHPWNGTLIVETDDTQEI